jgi:hypothetical protein
MEAEYRAKNILMMAAVAEHMVIFVLRIDAWRLVLPMRQQLIREFRI